MLLKKMAILLIILIILIPFVWYRFFLPSRNLNTVSINLKGTDYTMEIAKTPGDQAKGLGGRTSLCPTCGMIFTFGFDTGLTFWMKDTLIPLDMIFLDHSGVVNTISTAQPEPGVPLTKLKLYASDKPSAYVIELNAGDAQKLGLQVGDRINIPKL
ncbi:MAG TPA: DUF192 domain-containing protein [Patescibacteria group bacterium]